MDAPKGDQTVTTSARMPGWLPHLTVRLPGRWYATNKSRCPTRTPTTRGTPSVKPPVAKLPMDGPRGHMLSGQHTTVFLLTIGLTPGSKVRPTLGKVKGRKGEGVRALWLGQRENNLLCEFSCRFGLRSRYRKDKASYHSCPATSQQVPALSAECSKTCSDSPCLLRPMRVLVESNNF